MGRNFDGVLVVGKIYQIANEERVLPPFRGRKVKFEYKSNIFNRPIFRLIENTPAGEKLGQQVQITDLSLLEIPGWLPKKEFKNAIKNRK